MNKTATTTKTFAINGNSINGSITFRMIRGGSAVAVYYPAGMQDFPSVLDGANLRQQCDAIKAKYNLA